MPHYDFDSEHNRRHTDSLKWDWYKDRDVIPLWVADMDFKAPASVIEALRDRIDHGIFGYTLPSQALTDTLVRVLEKDYHWTVDPSWIVYIPGVVTGLNLCCRAVGRPGDAVMVPVPVYPPFFDAPGLCEKKTLRVEMIVENGRLTFDWEMLDTLMAKGPCLFLFCSPHNPGGTVFTRDELKRLAALAERHKVVICSDDIHCGLVLDGAHTPLAAACPEIRNRTITLMAPSKTYNIPGLGCSFAVIPDPDLRAAFNRVRKGIVPEVNALGYTAALAAYRDGRSWLDQVRDYLRKNREIVHQRIGRMTGLSALWPESTYLTWIDARKSGLKDPALFFEKAGVGLSDGTYFGAPGFLRLNFGCPRPLLETALTRMEAALAGRPASTDPADG